MSTIRPDRRNQTSRIDSNAHVLCFVVLSIVLTLNGCAPTYKALPTEVYATPEGTVFDTLAPEMKSTTTKVLYFTDRQAETGESGPFGYGYARSTRLSFGTSQVALGEWRNWDELLAWTLSSGQTPGSIAPRLVDTAESGHFPETPYLTTVDDSGQVHVDDTVQQEIDRTLDNVRREFQHHLERTPAKEVVIYVHGIKASFEKAVTDTAALYHLAGRFVVPICYSWPAGGSRLVGYGYERESGEFTIFHLKQVLRMLSDIPEIEKVHLLAHSRGTDIAVSALRELIIEARAAGHSPRKQFKIGHLVLIAADLDVDVTFQRFTAESLGHAFERITIYTSPDDTVMTTSEEFFSSRVRVGSLEPEDLTEKEKDILRRATNTDIILYAGERVGKLGHSYLRSPLVLADISLLLRGHAPGAESGRPLMPLGNNIWKLDSSYLQ